MDTTSSSRSEQVLIALRQLSAKTQERVYRHSHTLGHAITIRELIEEKELDKLVFVKCQAC